MIFVYFMSNVSGKCGQTTYILFYSSEKLFYSYHVPVSKYMLVLHFLFHLFIYFVFVFYALLFCLVFLAAVTFSHFMLWSRWMSDYFIILRMVACVFFPAYVHTNARAFTHSFVNLIACGYAVFIAVTFIMPLVLLIQYAFSE